MYQHGKKTIRPKNPKVILHASMLLGAALIVVAFILHRDLNRSTGERTTVPIVTEVTEASEDTTDVNEPLFSMKLPSDWEQAQRVSDHVSNYYVWNSTKKGGDDRKLTLHVDTMPRSYKLVRLQPLTPDGTKFRLGNVSSDCIGFAKDAASVQQTQGNAPVEAKWENVSFMCDPITSNQTIGTGTAEGGISATLSGSSGPHSFFFFYEDHNIRPDDKILQNILKSFQAR